MSAAASIAIPCRFPLVDPADVADPAVYAGIAGERGFGIVPTTILRAMGAQPAILRATWDLFRAVVLRGELPRIVKEMVGIGLFHYVNGFTALARVSVNAL